MGSTRSAAAKAAHVAPPLADDEASERALIARVRSGDRNAFGEIVSRHLPRALALAHRVLRHREDAEDLTQDAFLSALEHIDAFDPERRFWPWLSQIIVNRGLDRAASRAVRETEPLPPDVLSLDATPDQIAEQRDVLDRFRHALALLPPRQQLVLRLSELDGYSVNEIAELLSSTTSAVRWNLQAGRHKLRGALSALSDSR